MSWASRNALKLPGVRLAASDIPQWTPWRHGFFPARPSPACCRFSSSVQVVLDGRSIMGTYIYKPRRARLRACGLASSTGRVICCVLFIAAVYWTMSPGACPQFGIYWASASYWSFPWFDHQTCSFAGIAIFASCFCNLLLSYSCISCALRAGDFRSLRAYDILLSWMYS